MGIFDIGKGMLIDGAINKIKDIILDPQLKGIATIKNISYKDREFHVNLVLNGLDGKDIDITCRDIEFADDCSYVSINYFKSNIEFMDNILKKFMGFKIPVPDGAPRLAVAAAKQLL